LQPGKSEPVVGVKPWYRRNSNQGRIIRVESSGGRVWEEGWLDGRGGGGVPKTLDLCQLMFLGNGR
jgi:hypothetical protein